MKKRFLFGLLLIVSVVLILVIFMIYRKPGIDTSEIRFGALLPLTGSAAPYGDSIRKAIDLGVREQNAKGGVRGRRISVIYEDTSLQPKDAESAATKLITLDKVKALIGPMTSSEVEAILPTCRSHRIVMVSPSATDHKLSTAGPYFFRTVTSDTYEGKAMADFAAKQMGYRTLALMYVESAGPYGVSETLRQQFESAGGKIVTTEKIHVDATDMRAQLTRIKAAKPDALFFAGLANETITMLRQAKELGLHIQILAHETAAVPEVREKAGSAADGVILATGSLDPANGPEPTKRFFQSYRAAYNSEPQSYAPNAYDALNLLALAIERRGFEPDDLMAGLKEIRNYPGASGTLSFENGDVILPLTMMIIKNGTLVPFQH